MDDLPEDVGTNMIEPSRLTDLLVDLWRIQRRAERNGVPEPVLVACEMAMDRVQSLGFQVEDIVNAPYHEGSTANVIHYEGGAANRRVSECLSPSIQYNGKEIKPADIVVQGE